MMKKTIQKALAKGVEEIVKRDIEIAILKQELENERGKVDFFRAEKHPETAAFLDHPSALPRVVSVFNEGSKEAIGEIPFPENKNVESIDLLFKELRKAEAKFPGWPFDPIHAAAILSEEAGELTQAALDYFYGREKTKTKMQIEAAQTGAMAIRFLIGLDQYGRWGIAPEKTIKPPEPAPPAEAGAGAADPPDWIREPFRVESFFETETYQVIYADGTWGPSIDWTSEHGMDAADFCLSGNNLVPAEKMPRWAARKPKC
jgi:NTP pyrophosphatase (non-canonical NTP hydrolase)